MSERMAEEEEEKDNSSKDEAPIVPVTTPVRKGGLLRRLSVCAGTPRGAAAEAAPTDDFKRLVGLGTPMRAVPTSLLTGERARKRPRVSDAPAAVPSSEDISAVDWTLLESVSVSVPAGKGALAWLGSGDDNDADVAAAAAAAAAAVGNECGDDKGGASALLRRVRYFRAECGAGADAGECARVLAAQLRLGIAPFVYVAAETFVLLVRAHSVHAAPAAAARRFLRTVAPEVFARATPAASAAAPEGTLRAETLEAMRSLQASSGGLVSVAFPRTPRSSTSMNNGDAGCAVLRGSEWAGRVLEAAARGEAGRASLLAPTPFVHGTLLLPRLRIGTTHRFTGSSSSSGSETVETVTLSRGLLPAPVVRTRVLPFLRERIAHAAPGCPVTVQLRASPLTTAFRDIGE